MKAIKLKDILNEYSREELQSLDVRVFSTRYVNMGETIFVDSVDITEDELQIVI